MCWELKNPDIPFLFYAEISCHTLFLKPIISLVIYAKEIRETMTGRHLWPFSNPSTRTADIFLINATGGRWRHIFSSLCYLCISSSGLYIIHISEICLPRHWRPALSLSLSVCISFYQAPEPTCDVERFMGGPNAPASHAFIKDRLIPSRVVHSHDASNGLTWRIFHRDLYAPLPACCSQQSTLCLHPSFIYHTSYGLITIYPQPAHPQDHPLSEFICGFIYSTPKKPKNPRTRWCHSAVPALFIGNVEFFSATTLTQGISQHWSAQQTNRMYTDDM